MIPRPIKARHGEIKGRIISVVDSPFGGRAIFISEAGSISIVYLFDLIVTDPGYLKPNRRKSVQKNDQVVEESVQAAL